MKAESDGALSSEMSRTLAVSLRKEGFSGSGSMHPHQSSSPPDTKMVIRVKIHLSSSILWGNNCGVLGFETECVLDLNKNLMIPIR